MENLWIKTMCTSICLCLAPVACVTPGETSHRATGDNEMTEVGMTEVEMTEVETAEVLAVLEHVEALSMTLDDDDDDEPPQQVLDAIEDAIGSLEGLSSSTHAQGSGNRVGLIKLDFELGMAAGREVVIREQSMCDGHATNWLYYNKNLNKVLLFAVFHGLPYKLDLCYEYDPSTPYNTYPECVEDGQWQIWLLGRALTITSTFYYDGSTGDLIANEYDLDGAPPPGAIAQDFPVVQMICTPAFQSTPSLNKFVMFSFDYDQILDAVDSGGVIAGAVPVNIFNPTQLEAYYTEGGLPPGVAMNMDDVLDDLDLRAQEIGTGNLVIATSLEPDPKPEFLTSRDNLMIGWNSALFDASNLGVPDTSEYGECGTFQLPDPFTP